jgi:hypothetical protein
MAKTPSRRRGIMLAPRADTADSLTVLPGASAPLPEPGDSRAADPELLERLRHLHTEQQRQERQLTELRDELAWQRGRWARLERRRAWRRGLALSLLAGIAAGILLLPRWPALQQFTAPLTALLQTRPDPLPVAAPAVPAQAGGVSRDQIMALALAMGRLSDTQTALHTELTTLRGELTDLGRTVAARPAPAATEPAAAGPGFGVPRTASAMNDRYRMRYPAMPW